VIMEETREGELTLQTPMLFTLPVSSSFSICFHVSTWLYVRMISRSPSGSLGKRSSFPERGLGQPSVLGSLEGQPGSPSGFINNGQC